MRVRLKLNPGDRGTKKLLAEYGDKLVCVRYRYDEMRGRRLKTVETIIGVKHWKPPCQKERQVFVKTRWNEKTLHQKIRNAGGKWDKEKKGWKLSFKEAVALGIEERIVKL